MSGEAICDYEAYQREQLALIEYETKVDQLRRREEAAKRNGIIKTSEQPMEYEQQMIFFASEQPMEYEQQMLFFASEQPMKNQQQMLFSVSDQAIANEQKKIDVREGRSAVHMSQLAQKSTEESVTDPKQTTSMEDREDVSFKETVRRYSLDSGPVSRQTMKMPAIDELWELPKLTGKEWEVRTGNQNRYLYLKKLNRELFDLPEEERKQKIQNALTLLETNIEAVLWR